ncbi:hypothetical protein LEP1GSC021_2901 [Leptospira noguchii str. 1993005606]|uniref:Uncharacterized protein n=1 Tax=Leptospira noguchii str. 2007001578 TaxID=1049974 RepID=A0ABN0J6K3_9LEPT|nr:hypothetical protein LEP1GSC035_3704 [Leptospira noguchii str. 2007001578]EPE82194.1 hypothetical protein LEP1GSC021_2901 [Leptospira noguchii str. 1993005606]
MKSWIGNVESILEFVCKNNWVLVPTCSGFRIKSRRFIKPNFSVKINCGNSYKFRFYSQLLKDVQESKNLYLKKLIN